MNIDPAHIAAFGLALDIVGAVLIFAFGIPANLTRSGHLVRVVSLEGDDKRARRARIHVGLSHFGVGLLVAGFSLQLVGTLWPA